ncbi:hypothetical protein [Pseudoalteromonas sp. T1lg22]|uniref:hypothetical protein n=1 Tax=Pseudoalteromonas sp. T1lg22 TaxID=2077096 RepID=UPI000CF6268B|nr:hypothetical protein [Pseudoalteromonas sp. T1lg22]
MFEKEVREKLECMRIDSERYYTDLLNKFGEQATVFNEIVKHFNTSKKVGDHSEFNNFWQSKYPNISTDTELFNFSYELYNNLKRFYEGGVFELFKRKQAEWGAPEITILESDVPQHSNDKDALNDIQTIYRGLDPLEHEGKDYYQSWTTCKDKATEFAKTTYSHKPSGIVVKSSIKRKDILYYDKNDTEKEVIVKKGVIKCAIKI